MKVRTCHLRVVVCLIAFLQALPTSGQDHKSPLAKLDFKDGDSLVFLGDSITHQCLYTQYVEDFFYTRFPQMRLKFHNSGVGGARAWDALQRFDRDVAAYKPKYVTVLLGMNDGSYRPYDEQTFQKYRKDMIEVISRIKQTGATPILMTPTMFDSRAARKRDRQRVPGTLELYNSVLSFYGSWLQEVAVENGYGFVDMFSPLNTLTLRQRKTQPDFTMIRDSVHPDPPGQLVMAYAILDQMGLRSPVSSIRIFNSGEGKPQVHARGGTVSDLQTTADGLSFSWAAESLSLVLPEEAALGVKLLNLGHRMSREALELHGLRPGQYELTIDGDAVGTFSSTQLSRHIELQANAKTPQYRQALEVTQLNKQRNDRPVRALRNEWRLFQRYARDAERLKASPDDAELKKQVETARKQLEGLEERIKIHERAARAMEDRIFELNQPATRRYVLRRTS